MGRVAAGILTLGISEAFRGNEKKQIAPSPQPLPAAPSVEDQSAKAEEATRKKRAAATRSIYTSPLGIAGEAQIARKTLLGQ